MSRRRIALAALSAALPIASLCLADVDVEVRNADQVKGTLDPATETETFRFRVPAGAKMTLAAKGARKGPVTSLVLFSPASADLAHGDRKGKISKFAAADSGEYHAVVASQGSAKKGDYAFSAGWTSPKKFGPATLDSSNGNDLTFRFSADAGARVRVTAASKSSVLPRIFSITGPDGDVAGADDGVGNAVEKTPSLRLPATGDYVVNLRDVSVGLLAGTVTVTVQVTPPKASKRKIDITAKRTGTAGTDGAFARVVDAAGGTVTVPDGVEGLDAIAGTSISIDPGVLPSGSAIVIASAPAIPLKGGNQAVGPPVFFGPEGLKLGTAADPGAHLSIPVDLAAVGGDTTQVRVYTRNSKGKVEEVDHDLLDFASEPGFVRFPTSHFSSYVAAAVLEGGGTGLTTILGGMGTITDAALSLASDVPNRFYFLADGSTRLKEVVQNGTVYQAQDYAGGGASVPGTVSGVPKGQADFGGPVVTVASSADAVYVGTQTAVFKVDVSTGLVTRFAGTGVAGDMGDVGPATSAQFSSCSDLLEDSHGDVWIVDSVSARVRRVNVSGFIDTVAGTGTNGSNGDAAAATQTLLDTPAGIAEVFATSNFAICERGRVRFVDSVQNTVVTLAGDPNGATGCGTGGATGTAARFEGLTTIAYDPANAKVVVGSAACDVLYGIDLGTGAVSVRLGVVQSPGFQVDGPVSPLTKVTNPRVVFSTQVFDVFLDFGSGPTDVRLRFAVQGQ